MRLTEDRTNLAIWINGAGNQAACVEWVSVRINNINLAISLQAAIAMGGTIASALGSPWIHGQGDELLPEFMMITALEDDSVLIDIASDSPAEGDGALAMRLALSRLDAMTLLHELHEVLKLGEIEETVHPDEDEKTHFSGGAGTPMASWMEDQGFISDN